MHLVLVISSLQSGGAERVLSVLANHWASKGHHVTLITLASTNAKPFYPLNSKIHVINLNKNHNKAHSEPSFLIRVKNILGRVFCLRQTFKMLKPNVIISFVDVMNLTTILASINLKIPIVVSERIDPNFHQLPWFYKKIRPYCYKYAYKIIVQTNRSAAYFSPKIHTLIEIIPNFVKSMNATKLITPTIQRIITIGRLYKQKNHEALIKAFANIHQQYPHLQLIIYGEGIERKNLEKLIMSLQLQSKVFLPGTIQDIGQALIEADLFVFPSYYEGFPNALCEAMAVGLPVIASNCSGNIDIIRDYIDGRLFPVGDIKKLTEIMQELLNDFKQRKRLGNQAQQVCKRFNAKHIFKMWDKVVENAI